MPTTFTTRLLLAKQDFGVQNWHTELHTGFNNADARLFQTGAGSPVGVITPHYAGQNYVDTTADALWNATGAGINDWKRVDEVIVNTAANITALDATDYKHILAYATDENRLYLSRDPGGGYAWSAIIARPATIEIFDRDESTYQRQTALAATWYDIWSALSVAMEASVTVPAAGNWILEAEGMASLFCRDLNLDPAVRLEQNYDGGTLTYPDADGRDIFQSSTFNIGPLRTRVASPVNGKVYAYRLQFGTRAGNELYTSYVRGALTGYGPAMAILPRSYVQVVLRRVDL